MAERNGHIVNFNPVNRLGEIQPEGGGPTALFYQPAVTNPEPLPKRNDKVTFEAPDPRKNKKGKMVQGNATSVTITERAPEPPPRPPQREDTRRRADDRRGRRDRRERRPGRERREGRPRPEGGTSPESGERRERPERRGRRERRPREPKVEATTGQVVSFERQKRERKPREKRTEAAKTPKAVSQSIYPLAADIETAFLGSREVNPSLLRDKLIAWPRSRDGGWHFREKNKRFFLENIFLPAFENHNRNRIPWEFLRARYMGTVQRFESDGYTVAKCTIQARGKIALHVNRLGVLEGGGAALHHVYGYFYLPAESLKGLAARYAKLHSSSSAAEENRRIFGAPGEKGSVIFLDGMPVRRPRKLVLEAMNCHYPLWYNGNAAPSDDQEPELFSFLAIGEGVSFDIAIVGNDAARALELLLGGLSELGLGAKTSSGFGVFAQLKEGAAEKTGEPTDNEG